jgi:UTP--glucose-1-phosphate uridylyltransferase
MSGRYGVGVDEETEQLLDRYGFDAALFARLRAEVAAGRLSPASNVVEGALGPPAADDLARLPSPGDPAYEEARAAGLAALRAGRVGVVVLAGGMATRFGGIVKGVVDALDGRSFIEWKLGETVRLERALGVEIPTAVMTSFSTDEETRQHVREGRLAEPIWFSQYVSLRLEPSGDVFRDDAGRVSLYGPGHGDLVQAIRESGALAALRERGVDVVTVSNVDNLAARVDPVVVGAHLLAGTAMTVEVARKERDMGGAPARVDGRLVLLEAPCFPPDFDHEQIPVFNTNTATIGLDAFEGAYELKRLYVEKNVDGRVAVQLEHLYHELSAFVSTQFLQVPRHGHRSRFVPIKTPEDLERSREHLRELLAAPVDIG